ncbi:hypothetical protein ZWY2020_047275 [Hordeum vulgare]|nr:hypothetical protein ZWY2020_047275 [Hordeum vulgare]
MLLEDFGQRVDLTRRIREVLANYPEGTTALRELIQNADDAGASRVRLLTAPPRRLLAVSRRHSGRAPPCLPTTTPPSPTTTSPASPASAAARRPPRHGRPAASGMFATYALSLSLCFELPISI